MISEKIISIVIVNWNSKKITLECLQSLYSLKDYSKLKENIEVILIDNGSADGTPEEVNIKYPDVVLIRNKSNLGYAPACNQGLRIAKGKYTLLLGNDTVLKDGSLIKCYEFLESAPDSGAVTCKLVYPDGRLQGNCKKFPELKNAFYTYLSLDKLNYDYDMLWFKYDRTIEIDQPATTFLMVRTDILKSIGFFDEKYRILYNDVDLCRKIRDIGFKIYFIHTAEIIHAGSHSTKKACFKVRRIMYGDIYRYFRCNFGLRAILLLPILTIRLLIITAIRYQ